MRRRAQRRDNMERDTMRENAGTLRRPSYSIGTVGVDAVLITLLGAWAAIVVFGPGVLLIVFASTALGSLAVRPASSVVGEPVVDYERAAA